MYAFEADGYPIAANRDRSLVPVQSQLREMKESAGRGRETVEWPSKGIEGSIATHLLQDDPSRTETLLEQIAHALEASHHHLHTANRLQLTSAASRARDVATLMRKATA